MRPEVLLLTGLYDFSADLVCLRLEEFGTSYLRLNREQMPSLRIAIDPDGPTASVCTDHGCWELSPDLRSVWFRQPVFLRNLPAEPLDPSVQLQRSQWMALLHGLVAFDGAAWMNHPKDTYHAESKIFQLTTAKRVGFKVPKTLVGNDAAKLSSMFPDRFALKPVDTVLLRDGSDDLFAYMSIGNTADVFDYCLQEAPVIAQELFDIKEDIRVTVIADRLEAVRIIGPRGLIEGDWRLSAKADLRYESVDLPPEIVGRCFRLVADLGLVYAGIDLLKTEQEYIFLEANPTGEFGWLISDERPLDALIAQRLGAGYRIEKSVA